MCKLSNVQIHDIRQPGSYAAPACRTRNAKRVSAILLLVLVAGCGSGESTSETTPTNPEPTQPSLTTTTPAQSELPMPPASQELRGDLGNSTLLPGTYNAGQTLEIRAGDLILDAQGNVNAVWIFRIAGDLRVADGRRVILSGGAQAGNIYWWLTGTAQVGEYSVFHGDILP